MALLLLTINTNCFRLDSKGNHQLFQITNSKAISTSKGGNIFYWTGNFVGRNLIQKSISVLYWSNFLHEIWDRVFIVFFFPHYAISAQMWFSVFLYLYHAEVNHRQNNRIKFQISNQIRFQQCRKITFIYFISPFNNIVD